MKDIKNHVVKITVGSILFLLGIVANAVLSYSNITHNISNLQKSTILHNDRIQALELRMNKQDVQFASIETKLVNIESILIEIKNK